MGRSTAPVGVRSSAGLHVVIEKKPYLLPYMEMSFTDLVPDPKNPRYHFLTQMNGEITPEGMFDLLKGEEATINLVSSIEQAGGLIEPIIAQMVKGQGVIREGNRRWVAYRLLREKNPAQWSRMSCHIVPPEMDSKALAIFIGIQHRQGKLDWDGIARAGYIYELRYIHKMGNEDIASAIGLGKQEVERSLLTYQLCMDRAKTDPAAKPLYSKTYEAVKAGGKEFKKELLSSDVKAAFFEGLTKAPSHKQSRMLPKIIANTEARKKLQSGDGVDAFKSAMAVVNDQDPSVLGVFKDMENAKRHLEKGYSDALAQLQRKRGNKAHLEIFTNLVDTVFRLARDAGQVNILNDAMKKAFRPVKETT